jgi:hypothetical protein
MRSLSWRRPSSRLFVALLTLGVLWACSDIVRPVADAGPEVSPGPARSVVDAASCGVSFVAVTYHDDGVLAQFGIPSSQDTVHVCETWTGSDYTVRTTFIGQVPGAFEVPGAGGTTLYQGGTVSGYDANGGAVHAPVGVGSTAFDFMAVDAATQAAAYDDPYYAVYAAGCADPQQLVCNASLRASEGAVQNAVGSTNAGTADSSKKSPDGHFAKHGLTRRGIRALVNDASEIAKSPDGDRRFRKVMGDTEVIFTVDKVSALLIGEESRAPGRESKAKHHWKKNNGSYTRERTDIELTEHVGTKTFVSRKSVVLLNVTRGQPVAP